MATVYLAIIERDDYDAFVGILDGDIPHTFDEWSYGFFKEAHEQAGLGHRVRGRVIKPDEFSAYLLAAGARPDLHRLNKLAGEKIIKDAQVDWDSSGQGGAGASTDDGS